MQVAGIPDANRHTYLHLHLKGRALAFFGQLAKATREHYDNAVTALRARYKNNQRIQLQKLTFQAGKLQPSEESVRDFLSSI